MRGHDEASGPAAGGRSTAAARASTGGRAAVARRTALHDPLHRVPYHARALARPAAGHRLPRASSRRWHAGRRTPALAGAARKSSTWRGISTPPSTACPTRRRRSRADAVPPHAIAASSDRLRHHLDRAARTLGHADAAALAVVEVELEALARAQLDHRVVGTHAVAVVALEAVAARQAAPRLEQRVGLVEAADAPPRRSTCGGRCPASGRTVLRRVGVVPGVELVEGRRARASAAGRRSCRAARRRCAARPSCRGRPRPSRCARTGTMSPPAKIPGWPVIMLAPTCDHAVLDRRGRARRRAATGRRPGPAPAPASRPPASRIRRSAAESPCRRAPSSRR